jgi:thiol-disulfide isomerase/thioredoxin
MPLAPLELARMNFDRNRKFAGMALAIAISLFALASILVVAADKNPENSNITLKEVDPRQFDQIVAKHRGKVLLVDFWATWCAPCKEMFSNTVELHRKYHARGLDVISISFDEPEELESALEFLRQKEATFTNLISSEGFDSADAFQIDNGALPHYRLYDRSGKLVRKFVSGDPDAVFKEMEIEIAVKALLDNK